MGSLGGDKGCGCWVLFAKGCELRVSRMAASWTQWWDEGIPSTNNPMKNFSCQSSQTGFERGEAGVCFARLLARLIRVVAIGWLVLGMGLIAASIYDKYPIGPLTRPI